MSVKRFPSACQIGLLGLFALLLMLARPCPASAQTAGATLLVEARDPGGASVPGVLVTLASQDTGLERAGVTVDDGTVWLVRLPAGAYTLTAGRGRGASREDRRTPP